MSPQPDANPQADFIPVSHDPTMSDPGNLLPVEGDPYSGGNPVEQVAYRGTGMPQDIAAREKDEEAVNTEPVELHEQHPGGHFRPLSIQGPPPLGILRGAEQYPGVVSPVLPTAVKKTADPSTTYIPVSRETMQQDPAAFAKGVRLMSNYPGMPPGTAQAPVDEAAGMIHDHVVNNLLSIHDAQPDDVRAGSKLWYDGANTIAQRNAAMYGVGYSQTAGANAALSPQTDWYRNVSLGNRTMDALAGNTRPGASMDVTAPMDRDMLHTGREILSDPGDFKIARGMLGKPLSDVQDPYDKAIWIRLYDETHNPRGYNIINPDGSQGAPVMTQKGIPARAGWGSFAQLSNAVRAYQADNMDAISGALGDRHKVRSFYNNQMYPNAPMGDVTIDTHAVAAGMMKPLSGTAPEVGHNLATGSPGYPASSVTGIKGTYPIFADAYRDAAQQRSLLPRQMQSITWEGIRGLFTPVYKRTPGNVDAVQRMWQNHSDGNVSADDVRQAIVRHAGGYNLPSWYTGRATE